MDEDGDGNSGHHVFTRQRGNSSVVVGGQLVSILGSHSIKSKISLSQDGAALRRGLSLDNICKCSHIPLLLPHSGSYYSQYDLRLEHFQTALAFGQLPMVEFILESRPSLVHEFREEESASLDECAVQGHLHVLEWLARAQPDLNRKMTTWAFDGASRNGHLNVVEWLHGMGKGCTTSAMDGAALKGHLKVIKWLHRNRKIGCTAHALDNAASKGFLDVVEWLSLNRSEGCAESAALKASFAGHMDVVSFLYSCSNLRNVRL